ncbi:MAG TPA: glycogen/starch synthase [Kouleothrix sp.]|nr:glycogen/starch synthase [Kouleothrix sp.]HRC74087.1 glycogen/starch synthase [Kouleothrix sp.]
MPNAALKILLMSAEVVPFAKTGGLADVAGALPKALRADGHDVRVAMPRYGRIDRARFDLSVALPPYPVPMDDHDIEAGLLQTHLPDHDDIPVYMVDNQHYYERDGIYMYEDDADRFIFFCRATLEGIKRLGWQPDVIHCHDWHTAIVPNWLKTIYKHDPFYARTACVYTIHNLAYQGIFGYRVLEVAGVDEYGFIAHPDMPHLNDVVDFMGRGIYYADIINTVSETYADEILQPDFGEGLDPLLRDRRDRLYGVLNGIDAELNDPAADQYIAAHYTAENLAGKAECKLDLQREAGLPQSRSTPVIGAISRLADQKGFDLIDQIAEPLLLHNDVQLIVLGTGDQRYHDRLNEIRARFPQQIATFLTFKAQLAQKIYAGSDMFLMPSRFEPCGLGQMIALRYGSIPIVRATGGLADTVRNFDPTSGEGNGFAFRPYHSMALYTTIVRALENYRYRHTWQQLMLRAMHADHSWASSARRYVDLYRRAIATRSDRPPREAYQKNAS